MKILIVEDMSGQSRLIHKAVQKNGCHEIITAPDAFDAFAIMKVISIDVVILDNEMPFVKGMDLLQKIKATKEFESVKVIMITADAEYESFRCLGADGCLHKPFTGVELNTALDSMEKS